MIETIAATMPMFVCLFWATMLILDIAKERNRAKGVLLVFMFIAAILYFGHLTFFMRRFDVIPWSDSLYAGCNLAVYPLYLIYIIELTDASSLRHLHLTWLLPAVIGTIAVGTAYTQLTPEETGLFIEEYLYHNHVNTLSGQPYVQAIVHNVCKVVFALEIIPVLIIGSKRIRHFDYCVMGNYSDIEGKTLYRMNTLLIFFVITSAASFACNIIGRYRFHESEWLMLLPAIIFSVFLFAIGYVGHEQRFSIRELESELPEPITTPPSRENPQLRERLERLMEEQKPYLMPNLKLADLVKLLHSNRAYVYNVINRDMGTTFSEYINRLRVEHAKQLMNEQPELLHNTVAEMSGFSSATSFYRNFKLYIGCSPKEYQNNLNQQP